MNVLDYRNIIKTGVCCTCAQSDVDKATVNTTKLYCTVPYVLLIMTSTSVNIKCEYNTPACLLP